MKLTEAEREALRDWWDAEQEGDTTQTMLANLDRAVEAILAARLAKVEALAEKWPHTPDHYCCEKCALRAALDADVPAEGRQP